MRSLRVVGFSALTLSVVDGQTTLTTLNKYYKVDYRKRDNQQSQSTSENFKSP